MRHSLLALSIAALLAGCSPAQDTSTTTSTTAEATTAAETQALVSESERLNQWFETKYEEQLQMSPLSMTFLGRKDKNDQIDDMTEAAEKEQLAWQAATVDALKTQFDYSKLDTEAKTSYDLWIYQYEQARDAAAFNANAYVFNQMQGLHSFLPQVMMNFHKVEEVADMEAYVKRIGGIAKAIADLQQRAASYAEAGVRPPRFAYEGVIEQVNNLLNGAPFKESDKDAPLWADAKSKVEALKKADKLDDKKAEQLLADAKSALTTQFQPSYQALLAFLTSELDKTQQNVTGVSTQPNGVAYYNHKLAQSTTTDLTADEIHQIGLTEVDRLTKEMIAIKDKVGFKGSLKEFFTFIKTDSQFFYPDTDEGRQGYITDSEAYLAFIEKKLPEYFGILPKAPLVVKRVEAFREQPGAAQHYFPGTPDGKRPGIYYAHLSDMKQMPKNEMEAIAYHEGSPGHHMQLSIAQELTSVPTFRTQARFTAYIEGWGLYSELLAKEMGAYQNDYSDFGRLITEMWRAVRLVVDTGLHSKGWTEQQAVEYFKEKTPVAEGAVVSEVRRYLVMPGQATAYKIGMLKILEIRAKAKEQLGDKFDIRGFHDTILGGGALPLQVLEKRVQNWVDSVKAA
ncbi:MAG: DUF885 domain-containing protein [Gammaproteobacteria bacterium]|nr:DUF885 domain-containing protein [Gammaproteobacteria bacterium]MBU2056668.1 DUF885 domain-containing protein [Gammaproteobacteria bacterium]MBU2174005.1 DUF885 domain-containing protein [Gammaproteobacteria bacterium]MBU2247311.1 DUF885 domain-containing protein [Gammaproteobacteria bacterium]MBU2345015.1 DUF885 domain-containing protein [Gammaproteobacteria bacterium]